MAGNYCSGCMGIHTCRQEVGVFNNPQPPIPMTLLPRLEHNSGESLIVGHCCVIMRLNSRRVPCGCWNETVLLLVQMAVKLSGVQRCGNSCLYLSNLILSMVIWDHDSAPNRNEYQIYFLRGKGGRCVGLTTLPP